MMDGMPDIQFSSLSPDAGETVTFPQPTGPAPAPKISNAPLPPGQDVQFPGAQGLPPEVQADFKTLLEFMRSQGYGAPGQAAVAAPQPGALVPAPRALPAPSPGGAVVPAPRLLTGPAPGGALAARSAPTATGQPALESPTIDGTVVPPGGFQSLPNPQKAVAMAALGRLLTAGAARMAGGVAGAVAPSTALNANETADLKKANLGAGTSRVKMQDWDKDAPKPAGLMPGEVVGGGVAPKPAKPPSDSTSFDRAFAAARKAKGPGKTFTWNGKTYTTDLASEMKRKGPKALMPNDNVADALNATELLRLRGQT